MTPSIFHLKLLRKQLLSYNQEFNGYLRNLRNQLNSIESIHRITYQRIEQRLYPLRAQKHVQITLRAILTYQVAKNQSLLLYLYRRHQHVSAKLCV